MTHSPLFFYGTLRDKDILAAALGRQVPDTALIFATAPGYAAVYFPDRFYPCLVPRNGAAAPGLLLFGSTEEDLVALDAFEGDEYMRGPLVVNKAGGQVAAETYLPAVYIPASAADWTLERWTHLHRPLVLARETALAEGARRGAGRR